SRGKEGDLRKSKSFTNTFGKFPNAIWSPCKLDVNDPTRSSWIKKNHSDFDILIDDNSKVIATSVKDFSDNQYKYFVMPDFLSTRHLQGPNVYHVKTTVSDLRREDITPLIKLPLGQESQREGTNYLPWIIGGVGLVMALGVITYLLMRKKKTSKID